MLSLILMLVKYLCVEVNGARRWLDGYSGDCPAVSASELAKIVADTLYSRLIIKMGKNVKIGALFFFCVQAVFLAMGAPLTENLSIQELLYRRLP